MYHKAFERTVLLSIIISSLCLAVEDPADAVNKDATVCAALKSTPCGELSKGLGGVSPFCCSEDKTTKKLVLEIMDLLFLAIFSFEMGFKLIGLGVSYKNANSYFRSVWNCMDGFIVASAWYFTYGSLLLRFAHFLNYVSPCC